jgi:hypothetical protein
MARFSFVLAALLSVGIASSTLAQDGQAPAPAVHQTHPKKTTAKTTAHAVKKAVDPNDFTENWDIAAPKGGASHGGVSEDPNVAAGRKKFFEQSTTMENGGPASGTGGGASGNGSTGFTPSMGLSF